MKKYLKIGFVMFCFAITIWSCDKINTKHIYQIEELENLDTTCEWLSDRKNFYKENFMPVFYNYYNSKIKAKKYQDAATALEIVSIKKAYFSIYDNEFIETINDFSNNYRAELGFYATTFIDYYLANRYDDAGDFKKAIKYYSKILLKEPYDFTTCKNVAYAYYNIAFCYYSMGDQDLALKNSYKSLEYFDKIDYPIGNGYAHTITSLIHAANQNYNWAIKDNEIALKYYTQAKDTGNVYITLFDKIIIYEDSNNKKLYPLIDSTYTAFNQSGMKNDVLKISLSVYYAEKLLHDGKIIDAKKILDYIKPTVYALNSETSTNEYLTGYANYEIAKNDGTINTEIILKAIPTLIENENYQVVISFYNALKDISLRNNDYKTALFYEQQTQKAIDSASSKQVKMKVAELALKYQTQEKINQIELQKKSLSSKNITIALMISLFTALFLLILIFLIRQKQKKLKLDKQNTQIYTKQLLEKTEEERKRIASDLHDSVSHELLSLKNSYEQKSDATNEKIDSIINDIRSISRNLHPVMFDKLGLKSSIEQMVERAQSYNNFMVTESINYKSGLSTSDELQVYRIIQEALSNIIKYANAVAAKITINETNTHIHIEIIDNGKGFDVAQTLSQTDAFGLHNIIERSKAIGGNAKIVSDKNGTVITIIIKKT